MIEKFDPNCVCGGTRERPQPDDCERCQFVVALMAETKRAEFYRDACSRANDEVCQIAGKALGYMWFKDDQETFPGATEENGVFVGEHVAATIVEELVNKLTAAEQARDEAVREVERLSGVIAQTWKEYDDARMSEVDEARIEAEHWKSEGDMYGWNFHQGRAAGMITAGMIMASIIYHRAE